jgi:arginase
LWPTTRSAPGVADEPGGLTWDQLAALAAAMLESGGCLGCSIAIYDPDQDADGTDAAQIVRFAREVARRGRISS